MKIILVGHPGSQQIVPVSKYLTSKYLPMFEPTFLNYVGDITGWAAYVAGFLKYFQDENIAFALDDYLISGDVDESILTAAVAALHQTDVVGVKLCHSTSEEHEEYPVTTQYTIWDRLCLIELLSKVKTPWEFELDGSARHKRTQAKVLHMPCIPYNTSSALSGRWEGVSLAGLNQQDHFYAESTIKNG